MKIFISSVRTGLEAERDALPGLIRALGHEPVRFEDFSAQAVPSREACIKAVESSDAYLLLLGPHYGAVFPETGQSATEDEWVTAQRLGTPRFVLRKSGVDFDARQQAFEATLGDYGSGRFYKMFATVAEVLNAAAGAIHELEQAPGALEFEPLIRMPAIHWLTDGTGSQGFRSSDRPRLEVHIVPIEGSPLSSRILEQVLSGLPARVRSAGLVSMTEALDTAHEAAAIQLDASPPPTGGWNSVTSGSLASVRVLKDGQIAVAFRLPGDSMGTIVDAQDVTTRVASALRLTGQIDMTRAPKVAVGIGLTSRSMTAIGVAGQSNRTSASLSSRSEPVRVEPDESMSRAALDRGADEVAATLVRSLLRNFQSTEH
ncbi:DUF4062 domain-containing protein [Glaciibacter psychrotolerans]|uniref:DUF4062 domain-containing protein n=1 Tax=Glaciibacter psychrotolerans TaxID=670054 RepID=A0A7Z0EBM3_9MICO|nr:hypothetical protein [Leifsonia psychrotolerans]